MAEIHSPRITMQINGHRFVTAFRIDHPGGLAPTEYAIFETDDAYIVSVASGSVPKMGRLEAASDAEAISDAHRAVDEFHSVDPRQMPSFPGTPVRHRGMPWKVCKAR